jgi:hypothetical protein
VEGVKILKLFVLAISLCFLQAALIRRIRPSRLFPVIKSLFFRSFSLRQTVVRGCRTGSFGGMSLPASAEGNSPAAIGKTSGFAAGETAYCLLLLLPQRGVQLPQRALQLSQRALQLSQRGVQLSQRALQFRQRGLQTSQRGLQLLQRALQLQQRTLRFQQRALQN